MSMSDPIADMLTRIRNAQAVDKAAVQDAVFEAEDRHRAGSEGRGLHRRFRRGQTEGGKSELEISLKYYAGRPVIERIERVSRPGLRVYKGRDSAFLRS